MQTAGAPPANQPNLPVEIRQPRRVPESFGERIGIDLELGDELVLIGGDGREDRLREDVRLVVHVLQVFRAGGHLLAGTQADQVDPRLVPVHRV